MSFHNVVIYNHITLVNMYMLMMIMPKGMMKTRKGCLLVHMHHPWVIDKLVTVQHNVKEYNTIFVVDRSLEIVFSESHGLKGIDIDRFVVPPRAFANVSVNPSNEGFCIPASNCLPAGLLNASVCRQGQCVQTRSVSLCVQTRSVSLYLLCHL